MIGFQLTPDAAMEFFQRCIERKANTLEERMAIMKELQKELRAIYLNEKDVERRIRGKKVLRIKPKEGDTNAGI
jgi:hypothetical protein